ncbi:MAG: hypothetical protein ACYCQK_10590 [Acidiferrobacteraceae bacterium]
MRISAAQAVGLYSPDLRPLPGRRNVVSLIAQYTEVLRGFAAPHPRSSPLYVLDAQGRIAGWITAERVREPAPLSSAIGVGAAGDLMTPVGPVNAAMTADEIRARLAAEPEHELPFIDRATGELRGVVIDA